MGHQVFATLTSVKILIQEPSVVQDRTKPLFPLSLSYVKKLMILPLPEMSEDCLSTARYKDGFHQVRKPGDVLLRNSLNMKLCDRKMHGVLRALKGETFTSNLNN